MPWQFSVFWIKFETFQIQFSQIKARKDRGAHLYFSGSLQRTTILPTVKVFQAPSETLPPFSTPSALWNNWKQGPLSEEASKGFKYYILNWTSAAGSSVGRGEALITGVVLEHPQAEDTAVISNGAAVRHHQHDCSLRWLQVFSGGYKHTCGSAHTWAWLTLTKTTHYPGLRAGIPSYTGHNFLGASSAVPRLSVSYPSKWELLGLLSYFATLSTS